jgi:hypothetical protein
MAKKFAIVRFHAGRWPTELVAIPRGSTSGDIVEKMQRNHRVLFPDASDAVTWKVHEGNWVTGLAETAYF